MSFLDKNLTTTRAHLKIICPRFILGVKIIFSRVPFVGQEKSHFLDRKHRRATGLFTFGGDERREIVNDETRQGGETERQIRFGKAERRIGEGRDDV